MSNIVLSNINTFVNNIVCNMRSINLSRETNATYVFYTCDNDNIFLITYKQKKFVLCNYIKEGRVNCEKYSLNKA